MSRQIPESRWALNSSAPAKVDELKPHLVAARDYYFLTQKQDLQDELHERLKNKPPAVRQAEHDAATAEQADVFAAILPHMDAAIDAAVAVAQGMATAEWFVATVSGHIWKDQIDGVDARINVSVDQHPGV